jgi:hypothetical protein
MHLIATDSGPIEEPFEMRELLLTPRGVRRGLGQG